MVFDRGFPRSENEGHFPNKYLQNGQNELKYIPEQKCTKISAMVKNISNDVKEGKVSIKTTGDAETIFPIIIERLEPNQYYEFEIENGTDLSMAGTLEIIEYNEKDYINN